MDMHIDHQVLKGLREVMEDEYLTLVETFLTDSERRVEQLLAAKNAAELRMAAHSFKGSSSNMGAMVLASPEGEVVLEATRAAASARATGGRPAGPNADRMDGASLKAAVRAKVEERRAGKGRGPVKVDLPGGGDGAVVVDGSGAGGSAPTVDDIKAAARRVAGRRAEPEGRAKGAGPSRGFGQK